MRNKKVFIILIATLIVLMLAIVVFISILENKEQEEDIKNQNFPRITTSSNVMKLISINEFFTVESCVNEYFKTLNGNNSTAIYNLLNSKYIEQKGIKTSNVSDKIYQLKNGFEEFFAKDIYYKEISYDKEKQYYIYGEILGEKYNTIQTVYIIANLDYENMTFDITLPGKVEVKETEYLSTIDSLISNNTDEIVYVDEQGNPLGIKLNEFNSFEENVSENPYALDHYLKRFTTMAVHYPDIAYNLLDTEYKNKRFGSLENYKQYILNNKNKILNTAIKEYSVSQKEGYEQYTIIDTKGNYYIFKVTDIMKYVVFTDFYTIETEETINAYTNSNVKERVVINIQKVVSALNNKDYKYVYDKLADSFKTNKYPTLQDFTNHMNEIIIGNPNLKFGGFHNEGEIYIYDITLQSPRASAGDPVNMQIIMQLKENRDFVMSFSIK